MKKKRWLRYVCLFALAFLIAIPVMSVREAQAATMSGSCGDSATYELDTDTGTLTISGSGVLEGSEDWPDISSSVKKVVIGDEITEIGGMVFSQLFYDFSNLKTVVLGANVKKIDDMAFAYSESITTVTLNNKLTSIGSSAFTNCAGLKSITLPSSLKKIGSYAFEATGLTKVTIPKNVTSIGSGAFSRCNDLTKISVVSSNTKYSSSGGVLYNKAKTKLIAYPAGKSSTSFKVPARVTTISAGAFEGVSGLKSISLNKVKKIGAEAFFDSGLKTITIPKSVTSIGDNAFGYCTSLTKISVAGSNTKYSSKDGVLYNKAKTKLIAYPTAKTGTSFTIPASVKKIGAYAFFDNLKLKSVTIGSKVTEIEECAFFQCYKLKTVVIGSGVKTIGYSAFAFCSALKTVKFEGSAPELDSGDQGDQEAYGAYVFNGVTATIKYPKSEKSSWTKTLRSYLNAGAKISGGKLTFKSY